MFQVYGLQGRVFSGTLEEWRRLPPVGLHFYNSCVYNYSPPLFFYNSLSQFFLHVNNPRLARVLILCYYTYMLALQHTSTQAQNCNNTTVASVIALCYNASTLLNNTTRD